MYVELSENLCEVSLVQFPVVLKLNTKILISFFFFFYKCMLSYHYYFHWNYVKLWEIVAMVWGHSLN